MTANKSNQHAFAWIWLPGEVDPVVAGELRVHGDQTYFRYEPSYLERARDTPPISLYEPELPLKPGLQPPPEGLNIPGCIRDAAPEGWGREMIANRLLSDRTTSPDPGELDDLTCLMETGSDRIGALDFQSSATEYHPRSAGNPTLEELVAFTDRVQQGVPLAPESSRTACYATAVGGARPKALYDEHDTKYIAKFPRDTDSFNMIKAEYVATRLAAMAGLTVPPVKLTEARSRDVLLTQRFDREEQPHGWSRKIQLSALTLFGLHETKAQYASYETLADIIRRGFGEPEAALRELFSRLVFNILISNTDDHARNHAAFWDGHSLRLTPAYDLCPQERTTQEACQAMLVAGNNNLSRLSTCLETAPNFLVTENEARAIFEHQIAIVHDRWNDVCDEADISREDRDALWGQQFLNSFLMDV